MAACSLHALCQHRNSIILSFAATPKGGLGMHQPSCRRGCSQGFGAVITDTSLAAVETPHLFWRRAGAYHSTLYNLPSHKRCSRSVFFSQWATTYSPSWWFHRRHRGWIVNLVSLKKGFFFNIWYDYCHNDPGMPSTQDVRCLKCCRVSTVGLPCLEPKSWPQTGSPSS